MPQAPGYQQFRTTNMNYFSYPKEFIEWHQGIVVSLPRTTTSPPPQTPPGTEDARRQQSAFSWPGHLSLTPASPARPTLCASVGSEQAPAQEAADLVRPALRCEESSRPTRCVYGHVRHAERSIVNAWESG